MRDGFGFRMEMQSASIRNRPALRAFEVLNSPTQADTERQFITTNGGYA
jgi:hypothetical protein